MSRLSDIPVRIEAPASPGRPSSPAGAGSCAEPAHPGGLGNGVAAILSELASLLERLAQSQIPAAIDLHSLPMGPSDRGALQRALGSGEVQAMVHAAGLSKVQETQIAGVWWVEHRDAEGEVTAELLEVTRVPEILASAPDEIAAAARALRLRLSQDESRC